MFSIEEGGVIETLFKLLAYLQSHNFNAAHRKLSSTHRGEIWKISVFYPPLQPPCNRTPSVLPKEPSSASSEINSKDSEEFLEDSAKHSEDSEALKKQVQVLSNELNNCKRSHWREIDLNLMNTSYENAHHSNLTLEDCTEMEYLRNILFKYMMGHQPVVLAKVLAAVVKFDNQQTEQILLREEQKQTLVQLYLRKAVFSIFNV
ncbi:hypothetical protein ACFE04_021575 [Oxalis oulophora]